MLVIPVILLVEVPISIIASVTTVSATAVSDRYLWRRPLPYFSGSYSLASGNNWGSANKGTNSADLISSCGLTKSYRSSK